jgi:hypothetical protein
MSRYLPYLRIAFSAFCGLACVLLIVLWVRSYSCYDLMPFGVTSANGHIVVGSAELITLGNHISVEELLAECNSVVSPIPSFLATFEPLNDAMSLPYWLTVVVMCAVTAAPWLRWRFSLPTLLIAMTVVAIAIGVIVVVSR